MRSFDIRFKVLCIFLFMLLMTSGLSGIFSAENMDRTENDKAEEKKKIRHKKTEEEKIARDIVYPEVANTPAPTYRGNALRTGYTPVQTQNVDGYPDREINIEEKIISTPALGPDGTFYVTSCKGKLYAVRPDGNIKWEHDIVKESSSITWSLSSPAVSQTGDIFVGSPDGSLYALEPCGGEEKWTFDTGSEIFSSPVIGHNGDIYFGSKDKYLYSIDTNGALNWRFETGGEVWSSPTLSPTGDIYFGSHDGKLYKVNPSGSEIWGQNLASGHIFSSPSVTLNGSYVYTGTQAGEIYCLNEQGVEEWSYSTGGEIRSSPAIGRNGTIYVSSYSDDVTALRPNGNVKWKYTTNDRIRWSSPAVDENGIVYIGSNDNGIYSLDLDGSKRWSYATEGQIESSPIIGPEGSVHICSEDGTMYSFECPPGFKTERPSDGFSFQFDAKDTPTFGGDDNRWSYTLRWDFNLTDGGAEWDESGSYADHRIEHHNYQNLGKKKVLLEVENSEGMIRRYFQDIFAGSFPVYASCNETFLSYDIDNVGPLLNTYTVKGCEKFERVDFLLNGTSKTGIERAGNRWNSTLEMNRAGENDELELKAYTAENSLIWNPEAWHGSQEIEVRQPSPWFTMYMNLSDSVDVDNLNSTSGWKINVEGPDLGMSSVLPAQLNKYTKHFGGSYGSMVSGIPKDFIFESSNLEQGVEVDLLSFSIPLDMPGDNESEDDGEGDTESDMGGESSPRKLDPGASTDVGFDYSVEFTLVLEMSAIHAEVKGHFALSIGAGVSIDVPLWGIPFVVETGLTGGVDASVGTEFDIAGLALDQSGGFDFGLKPPDQLPLDFDITGHGGLYGELLKGLGRLEGGLQLSAGISLMLPSLEATARLSGSLYAEASALWGAVGKSWTEELYADSWGLNSIPDKIISDSVEDHFTTDLPCLYPKDKKRKLDSTLDPGDNVLSTDVTGTSSPDIAFLNETRGMAVWSDISETKDGSGLQTDIYWREHTSGGWGAVNKKETAGRCEYRPTLEVIGDKENRTFALQYLSVGNIVQNSTDISTFYRGNSLSTASWDKGTENWTWSEKNFTFSNGTISSYDVCRAQNSSDGSNRTMSVSFIVDSISDPFASGNGTIYTGLARFNDTSEGWNLSSPQEIVHADKLSLEDGLSTASTGDGHLGILYSTVDESTSLNQTVLNVIPDYLDASSASSFIVNRTPETIQAPRLSSVDRNLTCSWISNRTTILNRTLFVDPSNDLNNLTMYQTEEVYRGRTLSGLTPLFNRSQKYYLFQSGEDYVPKVIEKIPGGWGRHRKLSRDSVYSKDQVRGCMAGEKPKMILLRDRPLSERQSLHYRFDGLYGSTVKDESGEHNQGDMIGNVSREEHLGSVGDLNRAYGGYLQFNGSQDHVVTESDDSLNVTGDGDGFASTFWIKPNTSSKGSKTLLGTNGSWQLRVNESDHLQLVLWHGSEKSTYQTDLRIQKDVWSFVALDKKDKNITLYLSELGDSNYSTFTCIHENTTIDTSSNPLKIGGFNGSLDEFRLFESYMPVKVINRIRSTSHAMLGSKHDIVSKDIPSFVNFTHSPSENISIGDKVYFNSSRENFTSEWDFGDGTSGTGANVTHTYPEQGFYTVQLNATDPRTGVTTPYEKSFWILDDVGPDFEGIKSVNGDNLSAKLSWNDSQDVSEPIYYHVYQRKEQGTYNLSRPVRITRENNASVNHLEPNTTYWYMVKAVDSKGNMDDNWIEKSVHIEDQAPLSFDGLEKAYYVSNLNNSIYLEWEEAEDPSDPITYHIYRSNSSDGFDYDSPLCSVTDQLYMMLDNLSYGVHYFVVRAEDRFGNEDNNTRWKVVGDVENLAPFPAEEPSPGDGEKNVTNEPELSVLVYDPNYDLLNVTFYNGADDSVIGKLNRISSGSRASVTWDSLQPKTSYSWYVKTNDSELSAVSPTWNFTTMNNHVPLKPYDPNPANGAVDVNTELDLSVNVSDPDGNQMNVTFYKGEDGEFIDKIFGVQNGSVNTTLEGLSYNTTYDWYVEVKDRYSVNRSDTWSFTTAREPKENKAPYRPKDPQPFNGSIVEGEIVNLSVSVSDPDSDVLTVKFFNATSDELIRSKSGVSNGSRVEVVWEDLAPGNTYNWYASVEDGKKSNTSDVWSFTTVKTGENSPPFLPNEPLPNHGEKNVSTSPLLSVYISDQEGNPCSVSFHDSSTDELIGEKNGFNNESVSAQWEGLEVDTTYGWYVKVSDGENTVESSTWSFTTGSGENEPPLKPKDPSPSDEQTVGSGSPLLSVFVTDPNEDTLDVTFYDADSNVAVGTTEGVESGTRCSIGWSDLTENKEYRWRAVVSDGSSSRSSSVWSFYTSDSNDDHDILEPIPADESTNLSTSPILSVMVEDEENDTLDVSYYNASDRSLIGFEQGIRSGERSAIIWSDLATIRGYSWYVVASDGESTVKSPTWSFTTGDGENEAPAKPVNLKPKDGVSVFTTWTRLKAGVSDPDDDTMLVGFYNASSDIILDKRIIGKKGQNCSTGWDGLSFNRSYGWYLIVRDGIASTRSDTWSFTVKEGSPSEFLTAIIYVQGTDQVGEKMTFLGNGSLCTSEIVDYTWTIQEQRYNGSVVNHTFDSNGTYEVTLEVEDVMGHSDMENMTVVIQGDENDDRDQDGMPDSWEEKHGLDPTDPGDAEEDKDGDGFTNLEEYEEGTDPSDSKSHPEKMNIWIYISVVLIIGCAAVVGYTYFSKRGGFLNGLEEVKKDTEGENSNSEEETKENI